MQPVYVRKANPKDRVTWMDRFIAQEPRGGFRDVVKLARLDRANVIFSAILATESESDRAAA